MSITDLLSWRLFDAALRRSVTVETLPLSPQHGWSIGRLGLNSRPRLTPWYVPLRLRIEDMYGSIHYLDAQDIPFVSVDKHCKAQSILFSVRAVLAGLKRDEEAVQLLVDHWEAEFDFLSRASVSISS